MSDNNRNKSGNSSLFGTVATIGVGVLAAGAAYFIGKEIGKEETERTNATQWARHQQHQNRSGASAVHRHSPPPKHDEDKDDPKKKDEIVRECDICMRNFEELKATQEEIHTTPCGHVFCKKCIEESIYRNPRCPICRLPVQQGQTLRIYL